ncbi:MAG TPA: periplasmic heavy metal sensor [Thermoanaerobaculia bacterium]
MKRFLLCAAVVLTLAMSVSAAPLPPGKWWRRPEFATNLQLTNDQQVRLDMIFRMAANDLIDLRADAEKTSIAIRSELDQDQLNRENLRKLAAKLSETQGKLFDKELMMLVDMRSVLNNDQWGRLRSELDRPREGSHSSRSHD